MIMKVKNVIKLMDEEHSEMLKRANQFYESLNNLFYEGKVSSGKNLRIIEETVKYFKKDVKAHVRVEEKVIFRYLGAHIPRLEPTLQFLCSDHNEFKMTLKRFETLYQKVKKQKKPDTGLITKLRDTGVYLFCLMRNHIQFEKKSVYQEIRRELNKKELEELSRQCVHA